LGFAASMFLACTCANTCYTHSAAASTCCTAAARPLPFHPAAFAPSFGLLCPLHAPNVPPRPPCSCTAAPCCPTVYVQTVVR
jgi:hypothetical protein